MKRIKKVVDERQEMELLKIEHMVLWIVFWALLVSIIVQSMFLDVAFQQYMPEFIVFMVCCIGILVGCVKRGQWDYYTQPTMKTYAISSAIGSVVFGAIFGIARYIQNDFYKDELVILIIITVIMIVFLFAAMFGLSVLIGRMVKKKRKKLADAYSDDGSEE